MTAGSGGYNKPWEGASAPINLANARRSGLMSKEDKAKLDAARAAGIVVGRHVRTLFGLAGDAVYVNTTTAWTSCGNVMGIGPGGDLPAVASGASRRHRYLVTYQYNIAGGASLWFTTGGAPGTGTNRVTLALPNTAPPAANVVRVFYGGFVAGTPYSGLDTTIYGQATSGGTLRVWNVTLEVEDYIA